MEEHVIVDSSFSAIINAPLEQMDIPLKSKVQKAIHAAQKPDPSRSTVELDPDFGLGYYNLGADRIINNALAERKAYVPSFRYQTCERGSKPERV
jgi:hypothetical protein